MSVAEDMRTFATDVSNCRQPRRFALPTVPPPTLGSTPGLSPELADKNRPADSLPTIPPIARSCELTASTCEPEVQEEQQQETDNGMTSRTRWALPVAAISLFVLLCSSYLLQPREKSVAGSLAPQALLDDLDDLDEASLAVVANTQVTSRGESIDDASEETAAGKSALGECPSCRLCSTESPTSTGPINADLEGIDWVSAPRKAEAFEPSANVEPLDLFEPPAVPEVIQAREPLDLVAESIVEATNSIPSAPATIADLAPFEMPLYGTNIPWAPTLNDAKKLASETGRLVFLIQISGNFASEEFT